MKSKLLLCVAVLALAGCASNQQNSYSGYGNFGFESDLVPTPVQGLTAADADSIYGTTVVSPTRAYTPSN
jgi:uncharacterized protein YcfL